MSVRLGAFAAIVFLALVPARAAAAFPGADGMLAIAPLTGGGIVLISPSGGNEQLICGQASLCGTPSQLRWSPSGQMLAFVDASSSRIGVVAADGTCLWCLLGPPLSTTRDRAPAFSANGRNLTFIRSTPGGGLWRMNLSSGAVKQLAGGPVADAVWSVHGTLAIARGGAVWIRGHGWGGRFRRIAAGSAPSWSPDGSKLAIVRGGWIWVVDVKTGAVHRLARGGAPAWSPDGGLIAYIGPDWIIRVIFARGGRARSLGIAGRSVDWQPLSASGLRTCALPSGWQAVAAGGDGVLAYRASPAELAGWYGCLHQLGSWHLLVPDLPYDPGTFASLSAVQFAGRFALIGSTSGDGEYGTCSVQLNVYDMARGQLTPLASADCPSPPLSHVFDSGVLDSSGFAAWRMLSQIPASEAPDATACPAGSCIDEQLYVHDDGGTRVIDSSSSGNGDSIANVSLDPNGTTLSWTHDGVPRQATLG